MPGITIRRATFEDARDLANILCDSWKAAYKDILSPEDLERQTNRDVRTAKCEKILASGKANIYLALYDGIPCGTVFFGSTCNSDLPGYAEFFFFYSTEPYWGKGVGGAAMDFALAEIKRLGYTNVLLWVFEKNHRARRFYEKHGFVADGSVKDSGHGDAKEVRYRLKLK